MSLIEAGPIRGTAGRRDGGTAAMPDGLGRVHFYGDCSPEVTAWAEARLVPQSQAILGPVAVGEASWRSTPSTYIVATLDPALPPDFQRMFAAQADEVIEIEASHSPMLSRPAELAEILARLAG